MSGAPTVRLQITKHATWLVFRRSLAAENNLMELAYSVLIELNEVPTIVAVLNSRASRSGGTTFPHDLHVGFQGVVSTSVFHRLN